MTNKGDADSNTRQSARERLAASAHRTTLAVALAVTLLGALADFGAVRALLPDQTTSTRFELRVPVIYFHHIRCAPADAVYPSLYECPEQFAAQLRYLRDRGWQTMTADELADLLAGRRCPPPNRFVISLDDGYRDGYDNAAPIMDALGMSGTFYVSAGKAGQAAFMTFDQMRDLVGRGHAIGNHSLTHKNLRVQPADILHQEVEGAQQLLAAELGYRPRTFAYPYGRYDVMVVREVAESGLELAFTVHRGAREASDAPLESKRIRVAPVDTGADVLAKLQPYEQGCQPPTADLALALASDGPFKGNNVYSAAPVRTQTVRRSGVRPGQTYAYWVRIQNDGQLPDLFRITSTTTGSAGMAVRYWVAGVDVTARVTAGTYAASLGPWSAMTLVVRITPVRAGTTGEATRVVLRAAPSTEPTRVDVGRVVAAY